MNQAISRTALDRLQSEVRSLGKTSGRSLSKKWVRSWSISGGKLGAKSVSWSGSIKGSEYKSVSRSKNK